MMHNGKVEREKDRKFDCKRWGLTVEAVSDLGKQLYEMWFRFQWCFRTKTGNTGEYAYKYLRGLLTMKDGRQYTNIAQKMIGWNNDGQNIQHFMSDSPWKAENVFNQIQAEIKGRNELAGGMLTLDESGDRCYGKGKAGAARQYLGREGKVDLGQVGVGLGYYKKGAWALVNAGLYLPEIWFDEEHKKLWKGLHIPVDHKFMTKAEIGLKKIKEAKANKLPFEIVGCDSLYGRNKEFREELDKEKMLYMADIPEDTKVYLSPPVVGIPEDKEEKVGRPNTRYQLLNDVKSIEVMELTKNGKISFQSIKVRDSERGDLNYKCAAYRVWTINESTVREEWVFIREEEDGDYSFSMSNASPETSLTQLAIWKSQRYFVERIFEDMKSEIGWDELEARKYRAWMHLVAVSAMALWFIAEIKLDWAKKYPRDPELIHELEVNVLPLLSVANIREMLQAVLPLKQFSVEESIGVVVNHLVNRSRSMRSRLKKQHGTQKNR